MNKSHQKNFFNVVKLQQVNATQDVVMDKKIHDLDRGAVLNIWYWIVGLLIQLGYQILTILSFLSCFSSGFCFFFCFLVVKTVKILRFLYIKGSSKLPCLP